MNSFVHEVDSRFGPLSQSILVGQPRSARMATLMVIRSLVAPPQKRTNVGGGGGGHTEFAYGVCSD